MVIIIIIKRTSRAPISFGLEALHNSIVYNRTTTTTTTKHAKAANNSTAANNTDQKRQKMGEERERGTKDIAKPRYSTCNIIDLITVVFSVWDAFQR